jgi:hypothetical protein
MPTAPQNPSLLDVAGDIEAPTFDYQAPASWNQIFRDIVSLTAPQGLIQTRTFSPPANDWRTFVRENQMWIIGGSVGVLVLVLLLSPSRRR